MSLPWIAVHRSLPDHPRAHDLCDELQQPLAWAHLVALWLWCSEYASDGRIHGRSVDRLVERASRWTGKPGRLVEALLGTGWLSRDDDALLVVGWDEYQGAHIAKAARDKERLAAKRSQPVARLSRDESATKARPTRDESATDARLSRGRRASVAGERRGEEKEIDPPKAPLPPDEPTPEAPAAREGDDPDQEKSTPTSNDAARSLVEAWCAATGTPPGDVPISLKIRARIRDLAGQFGGAERVRDALVEASRDEFWRGKPLAACLSEACVQAGLARLRGPPPEAPPDESQRPRPPLVVVTPPAPRTPEDLEAARLAFESARTHLAQAVAEGPPPRDEARRTPPVDPPPDPTPEERARKRARLLAQHSGAAS